MTRPLVLSRLATAPGWSERLPQCELRSTDSLPGDLGDFDSVWIDASRVKPLEVARAVRRLDPAVQSVVVAPPEDLSLHERSLLFTPGLGEVWLTDPTSVDGPMLERAREVTGTRRRYRRTSERVREAMGSFNGVQANRAIVSDAFLAALLDVLPDPVISVDEEGRVVSWSEAAERVLGRRRADAVGQRVEEILAPADPEALAAALEDGRSRTARVELELGVEPSRRIVEAAVTPVRAGGVHVRSLVLRDVTREREALRRLEQAVEMRGKFYAAMSHEIRTPINAIMGYNELLRTVVDEPAKRAQYLERSQKAAQHLLALVNDVLDLSKLESGALEVERQRVRLGELVQDVVGTIEPLARENETPLDVECLSESQVLTTDPRRVQQILINLVTNAVKFGDHKPVRVRCYADPDSASLEVQDQGRGIDSEDHERIFEEFTQVQGTEGGTGLGLPISRKLAHLLGGSLTVDSAPGKGSTFRLRLPLDPRPAG